MAGPHRQPITDAIKRNARSETVARLHIDNIEACSAAIASAQHAERTARVEGKVEEAEEVDSARIRRGVVQTIIERRTYCETRTSQRNRKAELVAGFKPADREVPAARIARTDHSAQHRRSKAGIGKGEQIHRADIGETAIGAIIARCADRQPVTIQRNAKTEQIAKINPGHGRCRPREAAGKRLQHQPVLAGRIAAIGDDDVLGIEQQLAAALAIPRGFHRAAIDERLLAGDLDLPAHAADHAAACDRRAEEGGLFVRPDNNLARIAAHADRRHVDGHRICCHQRARVGKLVGAQALAALELAAQPDPAAADAALRVELRREQIEPGRTDIDRSAKTMAARGAEFARGDDLLVRCVADGAAVQAAGIDERIAGVDRATGGVDTDIAALAEPGIDRDPPGKRETAGIELDVATRFGAAGRQDRTERQEFAAGDVRGAAGLAAIQVDRAIEDGARGGDRQRAAGSARGHRRAGRSARVAIDHIGPADIAGRAALGRASACDHRIGGG